MNSYLKLRVQHTIAVLISLAVHTLVSAQTNTDLALGVNANRDGKFIIDTSMHVQMSDNFFYQPKEQPNTIVAGMVFSPSVTYSRKSAKIVSMARGSAELAAFTKGKADNYANGQIEAGLEFQPTRLVGLEATLRYLSKHDPFGQSRTEGFTVAEADLDLWNLGRADIRLILNDPSVTPVGLEIGVQGQSKRYTTNEDSTRFLDRDSFGGDIVGLFNLSPKTSFLIQYETRDVDYPHVASGVARRDGTISRALLGARWSATAKTSGDVRIGTATREFENNQREELETTSWTAGITWLATARTNLRLETGQSFNESFRLEAGTIDSRFVRLIWRQNWNTALSTTASASLKRDEFYNTDGVDDFYSGWLSANYSLDRGFSLFARTNFNTRDSNRQNLDFERTDFVLGASVQLN